MSENHVLPNDYHDGEDRLVAEKAVAHADKKRHIHPNDAGIDSTNVVKKDQVVKRKPRNEPC